MQLQTTNNPGIESGGKVGSLEKNERRLHRFFLRVAIFLLQKPLVQMPKTPMPALSCIRSPPQVRTLILFKQVVSKMRVEYSRGKFALSSWRVLHIVITSLL